MPNEDLLSRIQIEGAPFTQKTWLMILSTYIVTYYENDMRETFYDVAETLKYFWVKIILNLNPRMKLFIKTIRHSREAKISIK